MIYFDKKKINLRQKKIIFGFVHMFICGSSLMFMGNFFGHRFSLAKFNHRFSLVILKD